MSYIRTSRGMGATGVLVSNDPPFFPPSAGAGLPVGVSIAGSCDPATGAGSGYQTGYYILAGPGGSQCLTDAAISALYPPNLTPVAPPAAASPVATGSPAVSPVVTGSPAVCTTSQCLADMASLNAATGGASPAPAAPAAVVPDTMLGPFDVTQIEAGNFSSAMTGTSLLILAAVGFAVWMVAK